MLHKVTIFIITFFSLLALRFGSAITPLEKDYKIFFLNEYKTSADTNGNAIIIYYESLNLNKKVLDSSFTFILNNQEVYTGNTKQYHYLFEVFNNSYLLITYVKDRSFAAGPDLVERDSMIIIDLKNQHKQGISLRNIYLTRSKEFLDKSYSYRSDIEIKEVKYKYYAINDINLLQNKMFLYSQSHKVEEFKTYPISY